MALPPLSMGDPDLGEDTTDIEIEEVIEPTSTVVFSCVANPDGSYRLYSGLPPMGGADGGEIAGEGDEAAYLETSQGASSPEDEGEEQTSSPASTGDEVGTSEGDDDGGTDYTSLGDLLNGVRELIKEHHEASGGMDEQEHFDAGAQGEGKLPLTPGSI